MSSNVLHEFLIACTVVEFSNRAAREISDRRHMFD